MSHPESMRHISRALIGTCGSLLWGRGASIRSCPTRKCSCSRTTRMYWHSLPVILFRKGAAASDPRGPLAILVHDNDGKTRHRDVVAEAALGSVCAHAGARTRWKHQSCRVADGGT